MNAASLVSTPFPDGLPLRRRWHPMGYPVEIATNSTEVLSAAASIWNDFTPLSDASPVELRIEVLQFDAHSTPVPVMPCHLEHLIAIVHGPETFAIADMISSVGVIRVSRDIAQNAPWFIYHFLEPIAYVLLGARHFTMLHAACIALEGTAALLCGPADAGKTCLAYACAKRGWSFLSGDATHLVRGTTEPTLIGRPFSIRFRHSAKALFPEFGNYRANPRPNGKCDFELDPRRLRLPIALEAQAGLIVFLDRIPNLLQCSLRSVSRNHAREMLSDSIYFGDARNREEQRQALERLLEKPAALLRYANPYDAEQMLRSAIAKAG